MNLIMVLTVFMSATVFATTLEEAPKLIVNEVIHAKQVFPNLTLLDAIGARISGSSEAERAVQWAKKKMESYGFDRVTLDPCTVPKWTRGKLEKATVVLATQRYDLKVTALGGSKGTIPGGVEGAVVEVHSLKEVEKLGKSLKGKIVFYNQPMDASLKDSFEAYSNIFSLRSEGASAASKFGAIATLLRSLSSLPDDDHPHTGMMHYQDQYEKIPAGALSTHAANVLSDLLKKNPSLHLKLELSGSEITETQSHNVVGEITGSTFPEDIFIVGGHLDSWDLGPGDHDDGAGVVQSLEVIRALRHLKIRPKRTIRVVLYMSEEFGGVGSDQYNKKALSNHHERIIGALESDRGGFAPRGFSIHAKPAVMNKIKLWQSSLALAHADQLFATKSGGTDTEALGEAGIPEFEFVPESKHYFDFHHSALDQLSVVSADDLTMGAAAMAVFSYLAAEEGFD